ncbi:dactylin [Anaeramoeba flamelloides]|uniref:Dactylin n=1 Tax=Anaeramoeba flamelloides TaxID=1746091 RepID=A0ABQ8YY21_9EUKA|nr:dactylin [Anaeramoeba flamelloides]
MYKFDLSKEQIENERLKNSYCVITEKGVRKPAVKLEMSHNHYWFSGKIFPSLERARIPPKDDELSLDQLPDSLLYEIFCYLPPLRLIEMKSFCSIFFDVISEHELWRHIAYNHNELFAWDYLVNRDKRRRGHIRRRNNRPNIHTYGIQGNLIQEFIDKKPEQETKELRDYLANREIDPSYLEINSTGQIRCKYIEELENPEEKLLNKIKQIQKKKYEIFKKESDYQVYRDKQDVINSFYDKLGVYSLNILMERLTTIGIMYLPLYFLYTHRH